MSKTTVKFDNFFKEASNFGTQYSEACTQSSTIFMKGAEDVMATLMDIAKSSAEKQAKLMKDAMSLKTINEFADLQNKLAQSSFDDFVSGATKISEISVKVLTDSVEPVNAYVSKTMQKATQSMAA